MLHINLDANANLARRSETIRMPFTVIVTGNVKTVYVIPENLGTYRLLLPNPALKKNCIQTESRLRRQKSIMKLKLTALWI